MFPFSLVKQTPSKRRGDARAGMWNEPSGCPGISQWMPWWLESKECDLFLLLQTGITLNATLLFVVYLSFAVSVSRLPMLQFCGSISHCALGLPWLQPHVPLPVWPSSKSAQGLNFAKKKWIAFSGRLALSWLSSLKWHTMWLHKCKCLLERGQGHGERDTAVTA